MCGSIDPAQSAEPPLTVTIRDIAPGVLLCVVAGEIDLVTVPEFQETLTKALHHAPSHLVLDLTGVEFLGSAGLKILIELHTAQHAVGCHLALVVGDNRVVVRTLHITALDQVLDLHAELVTAVDACSAHPRTSSN